MWQRMTILCAGAGVVSLAFLSTGCDCVTLDQKYATHLGSATNFPVPNGFPYSVYACGPHEPDGQVARVSSPGGLDGLLSLGEFAVSDGNTIVLRLGSELRDSIVDVSLVEYLLAGDVFIPEGPFVERVIVPADGQMREYSYNVSSILGEIDEPYYVELTKRGRDSAGSFSDGILLVDWVAVRRP